MVSTSYFLPEQNSLLELQVLRRSTPSFDRFDQPSQPHEESASAYYLPRPQPALLSKAGGRLISLREHIAFADLRYEEIGCWPRET